VRVGPEPFDSPDAAALRGELERELGERYGGDTEPGPRPTADDVVVFLVARDDDGAPLACGALRRSGEDIELVLAGPSLSSFERWYTALPARDRDGIHLLGVISQAEKRDMLAAIDVLALPSRTESFGIVYLEAWANRKPVIAAAVGAVPELVRHGENGLLVPFGSPHELAGCLRDLLRDAALSRALGAHGQELVMRSYTWEHVIERVRVAYARALGMAVDH